MISFIILPQIKWSFFLTFTITKRQKHLHAHLSITFYPPCSKYITTPLHVCDDSLLQPDNTLQDHLGGKIKAKSQFIQGSRGTRTGAGQDMMVCKLSQPELNLRQCCNRESNGSKGRDSCPHVRIGRQRTIKQEQQLTNLGSNTILGSLLSVLALKEYSSDLVLHFHTRDSSDQEWSKLMQISYQSL